MGWLPSEQVSHAFVLPLSLQGYPEPQEALPMPLCVLSKIPLPLSSPGSQHWGQRHLPGDLPWPSDVTSALLTVLCIAQARVLGSSVCRSPAGQR